ncbi:P-loop containing nucleoside triphosphate hydrolase protein [Trichoderma citrinoviride]|uniref:P-loop containing nucleoside triphosphate hydrolase protein n=1 Tax=Trichoderma citrinoviride TaxID=58853 RepID=A0A2T4AXE5_9HYPO|nr:P-loop containing nucleoside triphosphate hydrolase protein [Trichoderma citrinoviride]PTB61736.1 P-loop containing nucleoside triphosphate hydrolase protein [Trichoderma citrinoviride]
MDQTYGSLAERLLCKWEEKKAKAATTNDTGSLNPPPRLLVAVAGPPGSGKTTIANRVAGIINSLPPENNSPKAIVISADGFHLPLAILRKLPNASEALARRGAPWTFDGHAAVSLVRKLEPQAHRQPVLAPTFDHAIKDPVSDGLLIEADVDICILEGNYLLCDEPPWDEIANLVDEKWFVHVEPDLACRRVAFRHLAAGIEATMEEAVRRAKANDLVNGEFIVSKSQGRYDVMIESIESKP